jgi:hypothetical protein
VLSSVAGFQAFGSVQASSAAFTTLRKGMVQEPNGWLRFKTKSKITRDPPDQPYKTKRRRCSMLEIGCRAGVYMSIRASK